MPIDPVKRQIFLAGSGGQGLLVLARGLAAAAARAGLNVISSETHGMAMRGGTVSASLKFGGFNGPLIPAGSADLLIGLEQHEARKFGHMLSPSGITILNTPENGPHSIDATGLALAHDMPQAANMIMLGLTLKILGGSLDAAGTIVETISPTRFLAANRRALELGYAGRA